MLPFAVPGSDEFFDVTPEIRVQRYGSVTVSEAIALSKIFTPELQELLNNPAIELQATIHARAILTAVLLISRYEPATTLDDVMELSIDRIVAASEFLLQERSADEQKTSNPDDGKPFDWEECWFKLRRHYPAIEQFNSENFGNCPLRWIRKALSVLAEEELERLDSEATAIALFGYYSLQNKGVKAELEHLNPWQKILATRQAKEQIPAAAAKLFLELSAQGKIPAWAIGIAPIEKIRRAADG